MTIKGYFQKEKKLLSIFKGQEKAFHIFKLDGQNSRNPGRLLFQLETFFGP